MAVPSRPDEFIKWKIGAIDWIIWSEMKIEKIHCEKPIKNNGGNKKEHKSLIAL